MEDTEVWTNDEKPYVLLLGGGTVTHVRGHLALCAPAYGTVARRVDEDLRALGVRTRLALTRMANPQGSKIETNEDVAAFLDGALKDRALRAVFFSAALCDFTGTVGGVPSGKGASRLRSSKNGQTMVLTATDKLIDRVKTRRPDVFLIGCKTTLGDSPEEQTRQARAQIRKTGADMVLANDTMTRVSMLVDANGCQTGSRVSLLSFMAASLAVATEKAR